jgi:multiple sugar transport system permease protein
VVDRIRSKFTYFRQLQIWAILFFLPALIILVTFLLVPIIMSLRMSFFDVNILSGKEIFIGLDNYIDAFTDTQALNSFKVTAIVIALFVPLEVILSLGLAMLVNLKWPGIGVVRALPLMATVIPMSIASVLWRMMYHPSNGLINGLIMGLGLQPVGFLTDPAMALPSMIAVMLWKDVGFYMIIFLAGLQGVPREMYEAAEVDGASILQKFRFITVPMLRRTVTLVLVLTTVFAFQMFIPAYVLTEGGPRSATEIIVYYIYKVGFRFFRMGYANALTMILLAVAVALTSLQFWLTREKEG